MGKGSLCKPEDLDLDFRIQHKSQVRPEPSATLALGSGGRWSSVASQTLSSSFSERLCLKKKKTESQRCQFWPPQHTCMHTHTLRCFKTQVWGLVRWFSE